MSRFHVAAIIAGGTLLTLAFLAAGLVVYIELFRVAEHYLHARG